MKNFLFVKKRQQITLNYCLNYREALSDSDRKVTFAEQK